MIIIYRDESVCPEYLKFKNLYKGLKKACAGVRWKTSVTQFEANALKNISNIQDDVMNGRYKICNYTEMTIKEPKERHITATNIRDRVLQRSLCDETITGILSKSFIKENCACQKDKGTEYALKLLKEQIHSEYIRNSNTDQLFYLKCDVHHFFESVNHDVLKQILYRKFYPNYESEYIRCIEIIDSFGKVGLGLGSQVSQLLALTYLDSLDHFVKEQLHIKCYIRYMDDFILISRNKDILKDCLVRVKEFLSNIQLELNAKTRIGKLCNGVSFLNWKFVLKPTGKVVMIINPQKLAKKRKKLKRMIANENITDEQIIEAARGMIAHLSIGNAYKAIQEIESLLSSANIKIPKKKLTKTQEMEKWVENFFWYNFEAQG